jgi:hypothetical protein
MSAKIKTIFFERWKKIFSVDKNMNCLFSIDCHNLQIEKIFFVGDFSVLGGLMLAHVGL